MEKREEYFLYKKIKNIIKEALTKRVFSACSIGILHEGVTETYKNNYKYHTVGEKISESGAYSNIFFDLASLTKPLVTSLSILALLQEKKLALDDQLQKFYSTDLRGKEKATIFQLLTHSSGLPAHNPYYVKLAEFPENKRKEMLVGSVLEEKLIFNPGSDNLYSDLGFMLLGDIIEKVSGEPLDSYWQRKIISPLGLENKLLFASKKKIDPKLYISTGECGWSKSELIGLVHDDNCRAIGGVAGHAGLFGSGEAVLTLCENLLLQYHNLGTHPAYENQLLQRVLSNNNKRGTWLFGFDTPTVGESSSGKYFSDMTIGHLGFTGTSFWIDLKRKIIVVFLTNRVFCSDQLGAIKQLRPVLHDAIMEELLKTKNPV